jgi:sugar/nucleoside kinase (ribokinase family)
MSEKNGIGFIGSVVVDTVSEVLEPGNLVYSDGDRYLIGNDYESEKIEYGTGGMAFNNSINFSKMGASFPLRVIGKIGTDDNGRRIKTTLRENGISDEYLIETPDHPTSMTKVLYVRDSQETINRTFRHYFGAMGSFGIDDIDYSVIEDLRIVMIGYCLLMPLLDREDEAYGAMVGKALEKIQGMGGRTCVDFVTPKRDRWWKFKRFRKTLRWVDILSIGEDQAEGITGFSDERKAVKSLVHDYGVGLAVVHCGDRGNNYLYSEATGLITQRIFEVPPEEYAGNTGAGDAFASGLLYGIHKGWENAKSLKFASAAAAISLGSMTTTDAMKDEKYIFDYMETRPQKN